jgi:hypothetical protein
MDFLSPLPNRGPWGQQLGGFLSHLPSLQKLLLLAKVSFYNKSFFLCCVPLCLFVFLFSTVSMVL